MGVELQEIRCGGERDGVACELLRRLELTARGKHARDERPPFELDRDVVGGAVCAHTRKLLRFVEPSLVDQRPRNETRSAGRTAFPRGQLERFTRNALAGRGKAGLDLQLRVLLGGAGDVEACAVLANERASRRHVLASAVQVVLESPVATAYNERERACHALCASIERLGRAVDTGACREIPPALHRKTPQDDVARDAATSALMRELDRAAEQRIGLFRATEIRLELRQLAVR